MGNVSLKIPSIHQMIGINSLPAVNHQREFTTHCISPVADQALVDCALAMAYTVVDLTQEVAVSTRLLAGAGAYSLASCCEEEESLSRQRSEVELSPR